MKFIKDTLEIIYFLSGPLIAYFAFKALGQINETKKNRLISSTRESYKIAAEKCDYFMKTLIPLINKIDKSVKESKITFFDKAEVIITKEKYKVKMDKSIVNEIESIINLQIIDLLNLLESFSLFFASGVAEEKIAYFTVGQTYCNTVKKYLPLIIFLSSDNCFNNTLILYQIWNQRLKKSKLEKEKEKIDKQLSQTEEITISAIGTK